MTQEKLVSKHHRLIGILKDMRLVAVSFSGGTDSALLLRVAVDALGGENVVALTGDSPSLARAELELAQKFARDCGVQHVILQTQEFSNPDYTTNPKNRCYHCKNELFRRIQDWVTSAGAYVVVCGANFDDRDDFRPGTRAGRESGVRSPLEEAGFTKADIRELSKSLGLPTFDKPASPCLASRIPYGQAVTPEKLAMIEKAERFLRELGAVECRVRHHDNLARIEVPAPLIAKFTAPDVARRIDEELRAIGYSYVAVDLRGFRSGSLNEVITIGDET